MPFDPLAWREYEDRTLEGARASREDRRFDAATRVRLFLDQRARVEQARALATASAACANAVRQWPEKAPVDERGRRQRCMRLGLYSVPGFDHFHVFECVAWRRAAQLGKAHCVYHCMSEEFSDAPAERVFYLSDDGETLIGWEEEAPDMAAPVRVAFLLVNLCIPSTLKVLRQRFSVTSCDEPLPARLMNVLWIE